MIGRIDRYSWGDTAFEAATRKRHSHNQKSYNPFRHVDKQNRRSLNKESRQFEPTNRTHAERFLKILRVDVYRVGLIALGH